MRKKLIFITTRIFWPTDSGRKISLYNYCKGLHNKYGYDIYVYTFLEAEQKFNQLKQSKPDFIKEIRVAYEISYFEKIFNIITKSLFFKKWPLQCSLYYSKKNNNVIKEWCESEKFDVVITDMIRNAPYITAFKNINNKILDMDDLLSKRYINELNSDSDSNFLGQYSKKVPKFINKIVPIIKNQVLNFEIKRLLYSEVYYANLYDYVIFVSDIETNHLNRRLSENKCVTVTTGCDFDYFSQDTNVIKKTNSISFLGNFEYSPNVASLRLIVNDVLPYVNSSVDFYVVGKVPDNVKEEFKDKVIFCGMVDDLRTYIKSTDIFVSPIAYGSGIKTKILEAMAMGMPVITNDIGAEGINITSGVNIIVCENNYEIANQIDFLLKNKDICKKIGEEAQKFIKENYQWEIIWKQFEKCGLTMEDKK